MTNGLPLERKVAIITGATGIGAVVSEDLAQDGAHVALIGRHEDTLQAKAAVLNEKYPGRDSLPVWCDVTDEDLVRAMATLVAGRFGGIDILVNTAGGTGRSRPRRRTTPPRSSARSLRRTWSGPSCPAST